MCSETDRAALRFALGVLRRGILREPRSDGRALDDETRVESVFGIADLDGLREACALGLDAQRAVMVRARVSLYLRARLRADAGDCGPWRCTVCVRATLPRKHCPFCERGPTRGEQHRRITPLWQSAPETRR